MVSSHTPRAQLIQQCRALYLNTLERLQLPVEEERLQAQHSSALEAAMALFAKDRFGNTGSPEIARLQEDLKALIDREFRCDSGAVVQASVARTGCSCAGLEESN